MLPWYAQDGTLDTIALMQGRLFFSSSVSRAVANAATVSVQVTAGAQTEMLKMAIVATGECTVDAYEGTTYSAAGTALTIENRNLVSANVCAASAHLNPTVSVLGSYHFTQIVPAGSGPGAGGVRAGSVSPDSYSFLMAPNSDLLFVITNVSGAAADINALFSLSEMTL